ncbi:MAG: hypothetical protein ACYTAF_13525 [Planctomycetota bacterium]|jgi:hypothetical protein
MHLEFQRVESLPRLAWCARLRAGEGRAVVRHGPWLETGDGWFADGAWDGPFDEGRPDEAVTLSGTAARLAEDAVVFAASTNLHDRLHLVRSGDELLVSNSLVFALVEAGDEPDPDHPYYHEDFLAHAIAGIRRRRRTLPMRRVRVVVHECANLVVTPDLAVRRDEKRAPAEPRDFRSYVGLLEDTLRRVFENAADPGRRHRYPPVVMVSRGYDSPATAVLAGRAGCSEALTYAASISGEPDPDDNGKPIAVQLGMSVTEHARGAYRDEPDFPEAEFVVSPPGFDIVLASLEQELTGRLLVTGRGGDDRWESDPAHILPDLRQRTVAGLGGSTLTEFRLRAGFLNFPPLFTAWQHTPAIHRIATSDEMRPWSLGGDYDRPIPRRIVEEAGIARELFGRAKMGTSQHLFRELEDMTPASQADYDAFRRAHPPSERVRARAGRLRFLYRLNKRIVRAVARATERRGRRVELPLLVDKRYRRLSWAGLLFHWGFAHIRDRYEPPPAVPPRSTGCTRDPAAG